MSYREQITIALIRDNGERRSRCLSRRLFLCLVAFFVLLVPLCALLLWQVCGLWQENGRLAAALERAEQSLGAAQATALRLHDLEVLLEEERLEGREYVLRNLARKKPGQGGPVGQAPSTEPKAEQAVSEGAPASAGNGAEAASSDADKTSGAETAIPAPTVPAVAEKAADKGEGSPQQPEDGADEQFQGVDLGYVKVGNVTARQVQARRLRIALDLRNTEKQAVASGTVEAILLTADGERTNLEYTVEDAGHFRIASFKRAVLLSRLASHQSLANAQVLLEVRNHEHTLVYSNLYPVVQ